MSMVLVESVTVGSGGASSIEFTSIPGDATDLVILLSARNNWSTQAGPRVEFNGDTNTANYSVRNLLGDGSSASSSTFSTQTFVGWQPGSGYTSNTFSNQFIYIPNYTSSSAKSFSADGVSENNATTAYASIHANRWSGTAAITSIKFESGGSWTFNQHTSASLYKITKA